MRWRGSIGTAIVDSAAAGANAPFSFFAALRGDSTLIPPAAAVAAAEHSSEERRVPPVVQRALVPTA